MDISLIVSIALGLFPVVTDTIKENSVHYQKHLEKIRNKAELLADESNAQIRDIPNEYLCTNPNTSIIFPAVTSSLPFIEIEEIRMIFAKLISSAYDQRKISDIHPSFINLITQFSPVDARVLSYLKNNPDYAGIICVKSNEEFPIINSYSLIIEVGIKQLAISLINLNRLGILVVDTYLKDSDTSYLVYEENELAKRTLDNLDTSLTTYIEEKGYTIHFNKTYLTQLGKSFLKVCIE